MKTFSGFPPRKVPLLRIPEPVFTDLLPLIDDLDELKLTLHVLYRLGQQRSRVPYLRHQDLLTDRLLLDGLRNSSGAGVERALARAVERGTLLRAEARIGGPSKEVVYFANTPKGRAAMEALRRGEQLPEASPDTRPNIFVLYEENIGPLTPLISEELKEAEEGYPDEWIEDAFREAVTLNKRSWKYIRAILERWHTEGRRDPKQERGREQDRRRYIEGEYGEYIEH